MPNTVHPINEVPPLKPNERIIRFPDVKARVGLSRSHIHNLVSQGKFPAPLKLGDRASGWLESQISEWIEQRIAESRPTSPEAA